MTNILIYTKNLYMDMYKHLIGISYIGSVVLHEES